MKNKQLVFTTINNPFLDNRFSPSSKDTLLETLGIATLNYSQPFAGNIIAKNALQSRRFIYKYQSKGTVK